MKLQKFGGFAVFAAICFYFIFLAMVIFSSVNMDDPAEIMAAMSAASGKFYALIMLLLWLVFNLLSIFFAVALHERMHADAPYLSHMMLIAAVVNSAIGIISAMVTIKSIGMIVPTQDLSAFRSFWNIKQGLKNAVDFSFAWCFLFAGCAILVTRSFPRILGWLVTLTGILLIPVCCFPVQTLQPQSGLRQIYAILIIIMLTTANVWLGIAWLRQKQPIPQPMQ